MATKVIFRKFRKFGGEIIALFPEEPGSKVYLCMSYQHFGQHGDADYIHCVANSRPARPEEYAALKAELQSIGYTLEVCRRRTRQMADACRDL